MHEWGSEWFDKYGEDLNDAIVFIEDEYNARTGCKIFLKEKWGMIRGEYSYMWFWPGEWPIYGYFYPVRMYYRWPKFLMKVERFVSKIIHKTGIADYYYRKQKAALLDIIEEAALKWPHIKREITSDLLWELS